MGPTLFGAVIRRELPVEHTGRALGVIPPLLKLFVQHPMSRPSVLGAVEAFVELYFVHLVLNGGLPNYNLGDDEAVPLSQALHDLAADEPDVQSVVVRAAMDILRRCVQHFDTPAQRAERPPFTDVILSYYQSRRRPCDNPVNPGDGRGAGFSRTANHPTVDSAALPTTAAAPAEAETPTPSGLSPRLDCDGHTAKRARQSIADNNEEEAGAMTAATTTAATTTATLKANSGSVGGKPPLRCLADVLQYCHVAVVLQAVAELFNTIVTPHTTDKLMEEGFAAMMLRLSVLCSRFTLVQGGFQVAGRSKQTSHTVVDMGQSVRRLWKRASLLANPPTAIHLASNPDAAAVHVRRTLTFETLNALAARVRHFHSLLTSSAVSHEGVADLLCSIFHGDRVGVATAGAPCDSEALKADAALTARTALANGIFNSVSEVIILMETCTASFVRLTGTVAGKDEVSMALALQALALFESTFRSVIALYQVLRAHLAMVELALSASTPELGVDDDDDAAAVAPAAAPPAPAVATPAAPAAPASPHRPPAQPTSGGAADFTATDDAPPASWLEHRPRWRKRLQWLLLVTTFTDVLCRCFRCFGDLVRRAVRGFR